MLHASRFGAAANGNGYSFAADTVESVREQAIRLPYGLEPRSTTRGYRFAAIQGSCSEYTRTIASAKLTTGKL